MSSSQIVNDRRPILTVHVYPFEDGIDWFTSATIPESDSPCFGCAIIAYEEPGQMAMVPWIKVLQGDEIRLRVAAAYCRIVYAAPEPAP